MSETYTIADVQKHKTEADGIWLIVENNVYDITSTSISCAPRPSHPDLT
jgi:cytochrome b involved in lipid metabolism